MQAFTKHTGMQVVYNEDHVDTDRIIPARFLSRVERTGFGELLFSDVRGPNFPLDQPEAKGSDVLVVGTNFGCGSSREHAVWAIQQAGFRAVIGRIDEQTPGFSDIFRQNSANCGLLLVELPQADHQAFVAAGTGAEVTIDLGAQTATVNGQTFRFEIAETLKQQIMAGLDLIGTTMEYENEIEAFEKKWDSFAPITN
ncbi:MAG: 3-isopropylmalate dehydratase small subunit [Fimbriimonadaceae bacterium]|nr:3-isopropylmalate dehydratase small subunit [Fimbriimonadaceae bacterium]